jgi:hypothetical protein
MKRLVLFALVLVSSMSFASETVVLEAQLPILRGFVRTGSKFYMNSKTGEGFVKAYVVEERIDPFPDPWCQYDSWGRCIPGYPFPRTVPVTIYANTVKVPGLMLNGDDAVFSAPEGNVICGTIKTGRILKIRRFRPSGNCVLSEKIVDNKFIITLTTK